LWLYTTNRSATGRKVQRNRVLVPIESLSVSYCPYASAQDEENSAYWQGPLKSHVFDVPLKTNVGVKGVLPGRAMPIPYTGACGTCHMVNELPFR
jgi:hypothetical protein